MMGKRRINIVLTLAFVGTVAYPLLVYHYITLYPPYFFAVFALVLISIRLITLWRLPERVIWARAFALALLLLILVTLLNAAFAVKAYPIIVSLALACVFGFSLLHPPTVIERIARITRPDLSSHGVAYTRNVTKVWLVFLLGNAAISAATALWGSLAVWTLWNGLLSYVCMGILFAAEYAVRRKVEQ